MKRGKGEHNQMTGSSNVRELVAKAKYLRQQAFEMVIKAGRGHLGGSLSCTEILVALYYGGILKFDARKPDWEGRDRFIMSKGHANCVLYVALADLGFFPIAELSRYSQDGGMLGGHCDRRVLGVEINSGSLGHGLGIASGLALGAKLDKRDYLVFVVLGDGECQEGSIWEAAMFASHHRLHRLIAIIDRNHLSSEDFTENTCQLEPLVDKWEAFGWEVRSVDGHSIDGIMETLSDCRVRQSTQPLVLIADTIKGKGISSLENTPKAHHTLPKGDEIIQAREDLR